MKHLAATGQAIRDQQQATDRLAAAMAQLTEVLESSVKDPEELVTLCTSLQKQAKVLELLLGKLVVPLCQRINNLLHTSATVR